MHGECGGPFATIVVLAVEPTATVIQFENGASNDFVTAYAEEAAMLDAETIVKGWARAGVAWSACANAADQIKYMRRHAGNILSDGPDPQCGRDHYTVFMLRNALFKDALPSTISCGNARRSHYRKFSSLPAST